MSTTSGRRMWKSLLTVIGLAVAVAGCAADNQDESEATAIPCPQCHKAQAEAFDRKTISHSPKFVCEQCHRQLTPENRAGHRNRPSCTDNCHTEKSHTPLASENDPGCTICHDPHGTSNLYGIRTEVSLSVTPGAVINFQSEDGQAPYSFAETGESVGSGICETCHVRTKYYNSYGDGALHHTRPCIECHKHSGGFIP